MIYISLYILPLLILLILPVLLRHRLISQLWLKWGLILCGVWLAQVASLFFGLGILSHVSDAALAGIGAIIAIWPQYYIWDKFVGNLGWSFFFANLVLYFVIGTTIGLIIQKVKGDKRAE